MLPRCLRAFSKPLCIRFQENGILGTIANRHLQFVGVNNFSSTRMSGTPQGLSLEKCSDKKDTLYKSVEIEIRSGEPAVLLSYEWFTSYAAKQLGITIGKCWAPPKAHHNRLTLLKSIHIYKKHRVQYEIRTYFRHMTYERLTESTLKTFLEYIQRNVPEGVAVKVTKKSVVNLPPSLNDSVRRLSLQ
ncbi:28S ribosomal protein S10, mitochondrial isoform X1 [Daphnia magna]|uniref:Small ribosomal subunit protein uS10m n=2 Tax=Daphnia magna TaxID=35525 RepID=A0A0P5W4B7_9CRUS|nr:28S ribosomal protein S10, mitochondrial isoform X1 [Daphnia magna]KZS20389.1 28S ribosomal protein S10, mitochondrial [Daphnia magna]